MQAAVEAASMGVPEASSLKIAHHNPSQSFLPPVSSEIHVLSPRQPVQPSIEELIVLS